RPLQPDSPKAMGALRRRLRLRPLGLATRSVHHVRILHSCRTLSKESVLHGNTDAPLRGAPSHRILRKQGVVAPTLSQPILATGRSDHLRQPCAIRSAGKVRMSEAPGIVGFKRREVLTNEAQI